MTRVVYRYAFSRRALAERHAVCAPEEKTFRASRSAFVSLTESVGVAPAWADDLLTIAKAVYAADKRSPRDKAEDQWSRTIRLTIELMEPAAWQPHLERLTGLLTLLTGDDWQLTFTGGGIPLDGGKQPLFPGEKAEEVALFSGGLDSTAYAATRLRQRGDLLLLISYFQQKEVTRQRDIYTALRENARRNCEIRQISQDVYKKDDQAELSARSRGLLYVATAIYAAAAHGTAKVAIPENGQMAVNPPLTPGRLAACSTRSVHPRTLSTLNSLIRDLGGDVEVVNPFVGLTKGEVCERALRAEVPERLLWETMSCGRPPIHRTDREFHCGLCYPCLLRRSGLLHAVGRDHTPYLHPDLPSKVEEREKRLRDLVALLRWLHRPFDTRELIADIALPPSLPLSTVLVTIRRSRAELMSMIETLVPPDSDLRRYWTPR